MAWLYGGERRLGVVGWSVLLSVLIAALLNTLAASWFTALEERVGDWIWHSSARQSEERRVIIVDIDERSLAEVGAWPWSRATQAKLIQALAGAGVREQIFDVVFADPQPDDAILAQAIQKHRPVLSQIFALDKNAPTSGKPAAPLDWTSCPSPFEQAQGYIANAGSVLASPSPANPLVVGHITPRVASDGVLRHVPAIVCWENRAYPALALATLMQATGEKNLSIERGGWWEAPWMLTGSQQMVGKIPLDERGDLRIPWRLHPHSFISLSAADVLNGRMHQSLPADILSGAWVLVGSSAFGLKDSIATPFSGVEAGVLAHAELMAALVDNNTPYTPRIAPYLEVLAALCGAAVLVLLLKWRRLRFPAPLLPLAALGWSGLLVLLHALLLVSTGVWIAWANAVIFTLLLGASMGILAHITSRWDRDRLYSHLSSYLPAPVAAALALQSPSGAIKARIEQVSVLFADIRNFSAYCETRPPEETAAVLHSFFSVATRIVEEQGGIIESFQGDAVFAVWNSGNGGNGDHAPNHSLHALQAAINLQVAMDDVLPDPAPAGLEPLSLGIGVETGPAMAGSFGPANRRTHMVMGRTVTIASRLVEMTADLAHPILVGEGLAGHIGGAGLESMGTFLLDGMRTPHHIYAYPLVRAPHIY